MYNKFSKTGKVINWVVTIPLLIIALFLYWSGSDLMSWVNDIRDSIFGSELSERRSDKYGFAVVLFAVGIPSLIPSFLYDFLTKQGMFSRRQA